jgi:uncharacterized glyoxalase superfamily protein PhnB
MQARVKPVPEGYHTITPYLTAAGAQQLLDFLQQAFAAALVRRTLRPDGAIAHAEARIGDSIVMFCEASEQWPAAPASFYVYVEEVDRVYAQALAAGARSIMEPTDTSFGDRHGGVIDPLGNTWWMATRIEDLSDEEIDRRSR